MLRRIIQNFFSSGSDQPGDSFLRLKFFIVNAFTVIGVSFVFAIGAFNLFRQYYPLGAIEIFGGLVAIINVIILRRTKNIEFASAAILFMMLCLFMTLLVFGGDDKTGVFWFFTYPLLAFFLKDGWRGFVWIAFEFFLLIVVTVLSELRFLLVLPYTLYEMVILCLSLMAVTLIVFFYVLVKNELVALQKKGEVEHLKKKIIDDQMAIAERIQRVLIPREDRRFGRLCVTGFYQAAAGVGGDYYDFFAIDEQRVAVIMCDVSGKSVAGAFVMVNIRSIFQQNIARADMHPAAMVKLINRKMLADSTDDIFAVLSVYVFDNRTLTVEFSNAGYGPFTYYSRKESRIVEVPSNSLPVGVIADESNYINHSVCLSSGDIIFSYTDGVLDGFEKSSETKDKDALYRLVAEHAGEDPAGIKKAILTAIGKFTPEREQPDDISLVISKVL